MANAFGNSYGVDAGMMQIAVFPNKGKVRSQEIVDRIFNHFKNRDVKLVMPATEARLFHKENSGLPCVERVHVDVALSIGGDGTLLGVCRRFSGQNVPVCGINIGTLGFLADIEVDELERRLDQILLGEYRTEDRLQIAAYIKNVSGEKYLGTAINDVVISKSGVARILKLGLHINGTHLMNYKADGLIVSSPTGSTAYSLSAGGPILNPTINALILTPICAHTFQMRPLVVAANDEIKLVIADNHQDIVVSLDGQENFPIQVGDEIIVRKAKSTAHIIKFDDKDYYKLLRNKLWNSQLMR